MPSCLVVSFRFLDARFHGRRDGDEPEWPPSPLRAFQALVAAAAGIHRGRPLSAETVAAFEWLERASERLAPTIVAPTTLARGAGYRLSVPNNALDLVGKAWARSNESMTGDANPATHRAMKTVRPTRFRDGDTVHFAWKLDESPTREVLGHVEVLTGVARHAVALGWGVDVVIGSAAVLSDAGVGELAGEHWLPGASRRSLRLPVAGTLDALERRHLQFRDRIHGDTWRAPPPLTHFKAVEYRRVGDAEQRPVAAFTLRRPSDANRYGSFDAVREGVLVAARIRHAAHEAARTSKAGEWSDREIASFVLGHGEESTRHVPVGPRRFAYLPLPSIQSLPSGERVGRVRRALVTTIASGCDDEIAWAEHALAGSELIDEASDLPVALLESAGPGDRVVDRYLREASAWASVTPVVLPGYDDPGGVRRRLKRGVSADEQRRLLARLEKQTDTLLRRAIEQAGFSRELAMHAQLEWRRVGFWPGTELAARYRVPRHLEHLTRTHVRIAWRDGQGRSLEVAGPICIGGGRFYGLGLLAAMT